MATVDLEHVHKTYEGGFEAVRDFNLAIKVGGVHRPGRPVGVAAVSPPRCA